MAIGQLCSVPDCDRELVPPHGRGMCGMHYKRWRRSGTTEKTRQPNRCSVAECDRAAYGYGLCSLHYRRQQRTGTTAAPKSRRRVCSIDGCDHLVTGRGWCSKHYYRWRRHGDPEARLRGEVRNGRRICARCGDDVLLTDLAAACYCRDCINQIAAARRAEKPRTPVPKTERVCERCGETFLGDARKTRWCSPECLRADKNRANWVHLNARRARLREAYVESFDREEIFERDGWICGLCGKPIDPVAAWPDPGSASLDHIIPIARGGLHERANAQASHLSCNVRKGAAVTC